MHDWTLLSILFDWRAARTTLSFRRPGGGTEAIVAEGVVRLEVPRHNEWGPSVSVNKVLGPMDAGEQERGIRRIAVEMQSGDVIEVLASSFVMPDSARDETEPLASVSAGK